MLSVDQAHAYIGPGGGFALVSSFLVIFLTFLLAVFSILVRPVRLIFRGLKFRRYGNPPFHRVVVPGLDGLSPGILQTQG